MTNEPTLDDLKSAVDLVDYIGQHTTLKKSGKEHSGCCPIHGENTPSLYVNQEKQTFHCFGCGAGGSVIDFISHLYGVDTFTAINQIKAHLGYKEGEKLEVVRRLTEEQQNAESLVSRCEIVSIDKENGVIPDACASLSDFGLFSNSCYSLNGVEVIPMRSNNAIEDVLVLNGGRGKFLAKSRHNGYFAMGKYNEHSQYLYLSIDYIDAAYLCKATESNNLFIFSPHINEVIPTVKKHYPKKEIRLILPNTTEGHKVLESYVGRYVMPEQEGYFCERDRKQSVKGVRNAK